MLISHSHRFLFVHVNRAAGGSISRALRPFAHQPPQDKLTRYLSKTGLVRDPEKIRFRAHETAVGARRLLPREIWEGYFTFAFVRNPWSWLVSMYHRYGTTESHRHHKYVSKMEFPEYVDWEIGRDKRHLHKFVCDATGEVIVDFVGRMESLKAGMDTVCDRLGVERADIPHLGARAHAAYTSYYDDALRERVRRHWAKDIELFGYDFE